MEIVRSPNPALPHFDDLVAHLRASDEFARKLKYSTASERFALDVGCGEWLLWECEYTTPTDYQTDRVKRVYYLPAFGVSYDTVQRLIATAATPSSDESNAATPPPPATEWGSQYRYDWDSLSTEPTHNALLEGPYNAPFVGTSLSFEWTKRGVAAPVQTHDRMRADSECSVALAEFATHRNGMTYTALERPLAFRAFQWRIAQRVLCDHPCIGLAAVLFRIVVCYLDGEWHDFTERGDSDADADADAAAAANDQ